MMVRVWMSDKAKMMEFNKELVQMMEAEADKATYEYSIYVPSMEVGEDGIVDYYLAGPFEC